MIWRGQPQSHCAQRQHSSAPQLTRPSRIQKMPSCQAHSCWGPPVIPLQGATTSPSQLQLGTGCPQLFQPLQESVCLAIGTTTALGTDGDELSKPHPPHRWSLPVVGPCLQLVTGSPITSWDEARPGRDSSKTAHIKIPLPKGVGCWGTWVYLVLHLCAWCRCATRSGLANLRHGGQRTGRRTGQQPCMWKAMQQHLPLAYGNPRDSYDPIS